MKRAHEHPALDSAKHWPALNLFRHKLKPDLLCAVPEDYPVPGFIEGSTWAFAGKVGEPTTAPPGFNHKTAEAAARFNGFYLFQTSMVEHDRITVASSKDQSPPACARPWMPDQDTPPERERSISFALV